LPAATDLVDGYFATTLATTALLVAGYAVSAVLRARAEEAAGRAEPVLATATGRTAWLGSHVTVALLGSAVLLLVSGATAGAVRAAAGGNSADAGRLLLASLAYVPAVWAVAALAVTLSGLLPRAAAAVAYAAVAYVVAATLFAAALDWPAWTDDLSPIGWTPAVPAEQWTVLPLAALTAVAAGLMAIGLGAFRRRDLVTG
jgi:ABC-2 type transport system permease protein